MADYIDLPYNMEKNQYSDIDLMYDANAVKQSMVDILLTRKGERELLPEYGSNIIYYLMEKINDITAILLQEEIDIALKTWEPRIRVNNINIIPHSNQNYYEVNINFTVLKLQEVEELQLKLQKMS